MNFNFIELFCIFGGYLGLILLLIIWNKLKGKPIVKFSLAMFLLIGSAIVIIGTITFQETQSISLICSGWIALYIIFLALFVFFIPWPPLKQISGSGTFNC
jgi:hypothetical protein